MNKQVHNIISAAILLASIGAANATAIIGGSALLTSANASQLQTWLGQGSIDLTNIYTKQQGDTAANFHAAANGKGATFSIVDVVSNRTGAEFIIGGYDPQSWISIGNYNISATDADRTAFIFNLTSGILDRQRLSNNLYGGSDLGQYQTFDYAQYGPTFGGGHDIGLFDNGLISGYSYLYSYSPSDASVGTSLLDGSPWNGNNYFTVRGLEVFTISADSTNRVPEPGSLALLGAGLACLAATRRRRRAR